VTVVRTHAGSLCGPTRLITWLALTLLTTTAHAGPVERLSGIAMHPSDPNKLALGYANGLGGLFVSSDGGRSFRIRASQSVALAGNVYFPRTGFPLLYTQDALLVGGSAGLLESDAESCGLQPNAALQGDWAVALARHPEDPDVAFVVSLQHAAQHGGLYRRTSAGELQALGSEDGAELSVTGLSVVTRAASQQALRFVETVQRTDGDNIVALVRYSDDLGDTWTERVLPDQALHNTSTLQLLAVDPLEPDAFLVAFSFVEAGGQTFVTGDAGRTFTRYATDLLDASAAAVAPDGRMWLGDRMSGLWFAPRIGEPVTRLESFGVNCLAYDALHDEVLICRDNAETGVDELGRLDAKTAAYCQLFQIYQASGFPDCPGETPLTDRNVKDQLCMSYCNASHFWYAPVCAYYDDAASACGRGVRGTVYAHNVATRGSGTRCEDLSDAPSSDAGDGDVDTAADAGPGDRLAAASSGCSAAPRARSSLQPTRLVMLAVLLACAQRARRRQRKSLRKRAPRLRPCNGHHQ
jgi:hypothetical protein